MSAMNRLARELSSYRTDPNPILESLGPVSEENLLHWTALLKGVTGTPYENGVWEIDIKIPENYPHAPPELRFVTEICHPNVHIKTGEICLDLLRSSAWSPAYTISSTLTAVHQLLTSPEADSPLNVDVAAVKRAGDNVAYESLIRVWSVMFAGKPGTLGFVTSSS